MFVSEGRCIDVHTQPDPKLSAGWVYVNNGPGAPWRYSRDERGFEAALAGAHSGVGGQIVQALGGEDRWAQSPSPSTDAHRSVGALLVGKINARYIEIDLDWLGSRGRPEAWFEGKRRITAALEKDGWTYPLQKQLDDCHPRYCRAEDIEPTTLANAERTVGRELAQGPWRSDAERSAAAQREAYRIFGQWVISLVEDPADAQSGLA